MSIRFGNCNCNFTQLLHIHSVYSQLSNQVVISVPPYAGPGIKSGETTVLGPERDGIRYADTTLIRGGLFFLNLDMIHFIPELDKVESQSPYAERPVWPPNDIALAWITAYDENGGSIKLDILLARESNWVTRTVFVPGVGVIAGMRNPFDGALYGAWNLLIRIPALDWNRRVFFRLFVRDTYNTRSPERLYGIGFPWLLRVWHGC